MQQDRNPARLFCLLVGGVLVAAGIIGFAYEASFGTDPVERDAVFGILDVNGWHNLVHIATGALALALANRAPREYALGFGAVYLVVTILGFVYGDGDAIFGLIPINTEDNILHLLLALTGLAAGAATRRDADAAPARTRSALS